MENFRFDYKGFLKTVIHSRPIQIAISTVLVLLVIVFLNIFVFAPSRFPVGSYIEIKRGSTINDASNLLYSKKIIDHPRIFKLLTSILDGKSGIKAGYYFFPKKEGALHVSFRIATGNYKITPVKITIKEGTSVSEIAKILGTEMKTISKAEFISKAKNHEGYLFPDTYYFNPAASSDEVISLMRNNFDVQTASIQEEIKGFSKPLKDVITMASIIEKEARTEESRRIIAGILWKRLKIGMPLQVDATFLYVNGKSTFDLTLEDLKTDSPYNTYAYKGLPAGPITNPGLKAILSTITPIETKYLYYLSDLKGDMHYAVTHDEHVANKDRYLR